MLRYEDFNGHVDAHVSYALDLPLEESAEIFRRRLADETWLASPSAWAHRFAMLVYRGEGAECVRRVLEDVAAALVARPVDRVANEVLVLLFQIQQYGWDAPTAGKVACWFAASAQPGDASLAAKVVSTVFANRKDLIEAMMPIASWLAANGAGELRARRHLGRYLRNYRRSTVEQCLDERIRSRTTCSTRRSQPRRHRFGAMR